MIDITEMTRKCFASSYNKGFKERLFPNSVMVENFFKFPTFSFPTIYEAQVLGEELPCFNLVLKYVMYQKREDHLKQEFQFSDGYSVIDAYELMQPDHPWAHIYQKLSHGDRILAVGFFEEETMGLYYYKLEEPRAKRAPKPSFLEKLVLSPREST